MFDEEKREISEKKDEITEDKAETNLNYGRVVLKDEENVEVQKEVKVDKVDYETKDISNEEITTLEEEVSLPVKEEIIKETKEEVEENSKEKQIPLPNKETKSSETETFDKDTKITGDLLEKNEISFDVHRLIYSKSYYKVESVLSVLKKEINKNNFQEIINMINESKYANDFEIRGFLFSYLIDKKIDEPTNIIRNLNVDEVLITYMFALINEKDKKKHKNIEKLMKEEIALSENKLLKKLCTESKKLEEDTKQYRIKKLKKLVPIYKKYISTSESIDSILESLTKYIFREYSLQKPKVIEKIYKQNNDKYMGLSKETNTYLRICLAKGFLNCHYIAKAKKMFLEILKADPDNYDAEEGLMLIKTGCNNVYSFVFNKNLNKNKVFKEFESKMKEQSDVSIQGIKEIYEKKEKVKREAKEVKLRNIRKMVAGFSFALALLLMIMQIFIKNDIFKILVIVFSAIYALSSFIRTDIKKSFVYLFIRLVVAITLVALCIVLPDMVTKIIGL